MSAFLTPHDLKISRSILATALLALILGLAPHAALSAALPGGASSLSETHGDWTVSCRLVNVDDTATPACVMTQQKVNQQRQRAVAIELGPNEDNLAGILVLPFGVAVTERVTLAVGETELSDGYSFSTCLAQGCIVPLTVVPSQIERLEAGKELAVTATAVNRSDITLSISLDGFTSAVRRMRELVR